MGCVHAGRRSGASVGSMVRDCGFGIAVKSMIGATPPRVSDDQARQVFKREPQDGLLSTGDRQIDITLALHSTTRAANVGSRRRSASNCATWPAAIISIWRRRISAILCMTRSGARRSATQAARRLRMRMWASISRRARTPPSEDSLLRAKRAMIG